MYQIICPLLFSLPAETAHHLTLTALKTFSCCLHTKTPLKPKTVMGIEFPNPVGLAAGLDKNGDYIDVLSKLGFGFIEIGTVTPKPQTGHPKPRLFRLPQAHALINRMGFNNKGVDHLVNQVKAAKYQGVLGINIGKNSTTPNERAIDDYLICFTKVYPHASYITINISSPNTPELRALQQQDYLPKLLIALKTKQTELATTHKKYVPLVVKISPDIPAADIPELATTLIEQHCDGVIISNTTLSRQGVEQLKYADKPGGLSGQPLFERSNQVLAAFAQHLHHKIPIIGVGGIINAQGARDKFKLGADLVQIYTGLIYRGPRLIKEILATQCSRDKR